MEMRVGIGLHSVGCIALAAVVGCNEPDAPAGTGTQVTDSAGISIITSPPVDAIYARLAEQPALAVGELDGPEEYLFGHIASVARDGAGNLVVADSRAGEIRVFDAQGRHLRTFGGMGEGPGEFQFLSGAWPVPNGIVTVDREQQRITRFGADGSLVATAPFTGIGEMGVFTTMGVAGSGMVLNRSGTWACRRLRNRLWRMQRKPSRTMVLRSCSSGTDWTASWSTLWLEGRARRC